MRVEINQRLIERNKRIAQYLFIVSMLIWLGGLGVTLYPLFGDATDELLTQLNTIATAVLPIGLLIALFAVHMTNLWVREPRPEQAIRTGLKGISNRSVLYHYWHSPAKHVLIAPQGVFALVVRFQNAEITVDGNRWRQTRSPIAAFFAVFRLDGLGDPVAEGERAAAHLKRQLQPIAPDIEVHPLIILTDPRATLEERNPSPIPILYAAESNKPNLRDYLRSLKREEDPGVKPRTKGAEMPLSPEQITAFEKETLPQKA